MKKYLNSPEQLLIAIKLGKVVRHNSIGVKIKMIEGIICVCSENDKFVFVNESVPWTPDTFYVEEK